MPPARCACCARGGRLARDHPGFDGLVGNDSIRAPVVDEPLAQYSMCLVAAPQNDVSGDCGGLGGLGGHGGPGGASANSCADRPTTAFASSSEYGGLIYDQAPGFHFALAGVAGRDAPIAALRDVVARHAFGIITPAQLRGEIAAALPGQADTVRALWDHYIGPPGCGS